MWEMLYVRTSGKMIGTSTLGQRGWITRKMIEFPLSIVYLADLSGP